MEFLKQFSNYLPTPIKNLTSNIFQKPTSPDITIRSAIFDYLPIYLLTSDKEIKNQNQNQKISNTLCLIICTNIALEIWIFSENKCFIKFFTKPDISLIQAKYVPIKEQNNFSPTESVLQKALFQNTPIIAISKQLEDFPSSPGIALFSLKTATFFHIFRFTEPLINFYVSQYNIGALLKNGDIRIYNIETLDSRITIQTIYIAESLRKKSENEFDKKIEFWNNLIPICDMTGSLVAYVQQDIVSDGTQSEQRKNLATANNIINKYGFARDAASKIVELGEKGYSGIKNFFNTRKAANIGSEIPDPTINLAASRLATPRGNEEVKSPRFSVNEGTKRERLKSSEIIEEKFESDIDFESENENEEIKEKPNDGSNSDSEYVEITPTMVKKAKYHDFKQYNNKISNTGGEAKSIRKNTEDFYGNKYSVIIKRISDNFPLATISPPYFTKISLLKFSPSGNLLLIGNENSQHFYIYRLFPETALRHINEKSSKHQKAAILIYSIFRGYTSATVSNVAFSFDDNWLIINSSKGTSHIYKLDNDVILYESDTRITRNSMKFDYKNNLQKSTKVINLSAFGRYKYIPTYCENINPVTTIISHFPLNSLESKKELFLRMGANFFKINDGFYDDENCEIPLFLTITAEARIYENALLILKENKSFFNKESKDCKEKLEVTNITEYNILLDDKPKKIRTVLDKNVIPVISKEIKFTKENVREKTEITTSSSSPFESQEIYESRHKWLRELVTINCNCGEIDYNNAFENLNLCNMVIDAEKKVKISGNIYEEILSNEIQYEKYSSEKNKHLLKNEEEKNLAEIPKEISQLEKIMGNYDENMPKEKNPFDLSRSGFEFENKIENTLKEISQINIPKKEEKKSDLNEDDMIENTKSIYE